VRFKRREEKRNLLTSPAQPIVRTIMVCVELNFGDYYYKVYYICFIVVVVVVTCTILKKRNKINKQTNKIEFSARAEHT
jgi:hypothetical protein